MEVYAKVLQEVKPSKKEEREVLKAASSFMAVLKPRFKEADVFLGGSIAKGTWLKGNYDTDIFVRFDYKKFQNSTQLSDRVERELKKLKLDYERIHGSRDYFSVKKEKFNFEVVPILKINTSEKARNITDISPLHVLWVKKKISQKMADEVRILKTFCHAQDIYGAESYIRGFSGYACEVLIAYASSFEDLLKNASHWSSKEVIDIERYYKNRNPLKELNQAKTESPLILIDPVQDTRNIAAALSDEKYHKFKEAAKRFLNRPNISYFRKEKITREFLQKNEKSRKLIMVKVIPVDGRKDVVAAKMRKAFEYAEKNLRKDFRVYQSGWSFEEGILWFYVDKKPISEHVELAGPPLSHSKDVARFRQVHKNTFVKAKRLVAKEKRKYGLAEDFLKGLEKDQYIASRVGDWRVE